MDTFPVIFSLHLGPVFVLICKMPMVKLIAQYQKWWPLTLTPHIELHFPESLAIRFVVNWIPPLRAMYTGLRSGRKPANSAPWHQLAESLASGIPSKHLPLYYDLLQFLGLPGLPNFSSKPEQEWQLPLTLAPLALQQFWKHPILRIKSFFSPSYSITFPSDSSIIDANLYLPNTVQNILPVLPHYTR